MQKKRENQRGEKVTKSNALDEFTKMSETLSNTYVEEWKQQGKKVLAYNCTYMPEEIIHAAGLLPFRIKGTGCTGTTQADSYLSIVNCSFCRACLELLMQGKYDFLDGAVFVDSCDHMHVTYANWKAQEKTPFMENIISVPNIITEYGLKFYIEELSNIKEKIEEHFDVTITDENLKDAIITYNETRGLQKKVFALMDKDAPPITGSQSLSIIVAGTSMPKDQYNGLIEQLLSELEGKEGVSGFNHRLMVGGSALDDPALYNIIEELGGLVVSDTLCFGARFFQDPIKEDGEPLSVLADQYLNQIRCPRMFDSYDKRLSYALDTAERSNVDGIILQGIKNCDCHGVDNAMLEKDLEDKGVPVLVLEREYNPIADAGRIRTRVQAFLERIA